MKKLVEEVEGEGLTKLLGQRVLLFCLNYTYEGKLIGVNETDVLLDDAGIVFETGPFNESAFKDLQKLPHPQHYIRTGAIESYGLSK